MLVPAVRHTPLLPAGSDHNDGFASVVLVNVSVRRVTPVAPATAGIIATAVVTKKMNDSTDFARFMNIGMSSEYPSRMNAIGRSAVLLVFGSF
jgi:hypothetical protein